MLKLWNTPDRQLKEFHPRKKGQVGLYACGPTVYQTAHIGNLRSYIFEDVLKRTLQFLGYRVNHVMNITDVGHLVSDADVGEDKIEREAARRAKSAWDIAREHEAEFLRDLDRLNVEQPVVLPRATEHIAEQIALIGQLEKKGFTYRTSDGVYFDTSKFPDYGKLSGQPLEEKEEGARVAANPEKRNPSDFALWKLSEPKRAHPELVEGSPERRGEAMPRPRRQMEWESPWGVGFPGWHIECSAMSVKYLGQPFDIHCGGVDHIPVHHENEIAQSVAATGKPLAHFWLHHEHLIVDGKRMGKSEGNAYTLDDLIAKGFDPLDFRFFCLGAHYRSKLNFTWEALEGARSAMKKLRAEARRLEVGRSPHEETITFFRNALEEDLNTPQALALLWEHLKSDHAPAVKGATLLKMDEVLGLRLAEVVGKALEIPADVVALAEERQLAREKKEWKKSDELRARIKEKGWMVEDTKDGFDLVPS
jgi:cysteinyl-tRNA synthetase